MFMELCSSHMRFYLPYFFIYLELSEIRRMSNQPTPPPENEFLFDSIVQRDMSGVYKQFGGLGTAAGRKMYALYNKEESAAKRAQYRMELGE